MRAAALALLLLPAPARAARHSWLQGGWAQPSPSIRPAELPALLLPRSELPLRPGLPDAYPPGSSFAGAPRYDDVLLDLAPSAPAAEVRKAAAALAVQGGPEAAEAAIRRAHAEGRQLSLRELMPADAAALTGTESSCFGPNCFNATELWHGLTRRLREADDVDAFAMLFDKFAPLKKGERLRHGDVIAVHRGRGDDPGSLQHTAVYVGQDFVWHKAGAGASLPWTFERVAGMLDPYMTRSGPAAELRLHRRR